MSVVTPLPKLHAGTPAQALRPPQPCTPKRFDMAEIEDVPLDGEESFVDKLSQLDRGLQVFLAGLAIGTTVLVVTIVRMCRAAFATEGGYGEDIALAPAPAVAPKQPARPHATSQIRPISPNGKRASGGSRSAKNGRDIESGEGDEARGSSRPKPGRAKPPPKATASGGRKAPSEEKAPLRKSLGSEKSSRKAAFQPVCSKASSDGGSQVTSGDDDGQSASYSDDRSDDQNSGSSDDSGNSDSAPLMTRLTFQVAPAQHHTHTSFPTARPNALRARRRLTARPSRLSWTCPTFRALRS